LEFGLTGKERGGVCKTLRSKVSTVNGFTLVN